ncbi:MAG: mobilization protein [Burkholderiales bacterium]
MSQLHFIGGEKGGVGKSVVSRVLAQYFIDRGLPFIGFDTDRSHGALMRFYGEYASPVFIDSHDSLDRVFEAAAENPARRVLVDLAAQTQRSLGLWFDDSGVLDVAGDMGLTLTYWHVMDAGRDSVDLLRELLDRFGHRLKLVLVLNEIRGDQFTLLAESGQLERARSLGAQVVSLRKLPDTIMQKLDGVNASFWAAVNHSEPGSAPLGVLDRQRVKVWLQRAYDEIEAVGA